LNNSKFKKTNNPATYKPWTGAHQFDWIPMRRVLLQFNPDQLTDRGRIRKAKIRFIRNALSLYATEEQQLAAGLGVEEEKSA
jgi:hypothetical protein